MRMNTKEALLASLEAGNVHEYHLFLKSSLSQWHKESFVHDGINYANAEQAMMAAKARLFKDAETLALILSTNSPKEIQKLGRLVKNYDEVVWDAARYQIVLQINLAKFSQCEAPRELLLSTGDKVLVECNMIDSIWGIGLGLDDMRTKIPHEWKGRNLLGFCLMEVRAALQG